MLSVEDYLQMVLGLARPQSAELVPVSAGFGRGLAQDLVAHCAVPPFDNSAMDGFAVRAADCPGELRVVDDIPAGGYSERRIEAGQAARIMTGAPLPAGADTVVPVEETDQPIGPAPLPELVRIAAQPALGRHIRRQGEDTQVGQLKLRAGERWTPAAAAAAASIGWGEVLLRRTPRVAVLATGDELVPPGVALGLGQIPDSNSVLLAGLVQQFGGELHSVCRVGDEVSAFDEAIQQAAAEADVVVTAGGVSAGAFEVVRQGLSARADFVKVAMQPGKPQACGLLRGPDGRNTVFLGLPGNPVSVFVSAWVILRPLLAHLGGWPGAWPAQRVRVAAGWRGPRGRRQYVPVLLQDGEVRPVHELGSGSHLVASLHLANALAVVPEGTTEVAAGHEVACYGI